VLERSEALSAWDAKNSIVMLTIFRRVRKGLLGEGAVPKPASSPVPSGTEGKVERYLLYAVGEIALVVIGILIALQINNWNEMRKERMEEQVILIQLKKEYEANHLQLDQKISARSQIISTSREILKIVDSSSPALIDSINIKMSPVLLDPTFDPIENDLFSSGSLHLIRNEDLKRLLSNWSSDIRAVSEVEEMWTRVTHEELIPFCSEIGISRTVMNNFMASWKDGNDQWLLDASFMEDISIGNSFIQAESLDPDEIKKLEGLLSVAITYNYAANLQSKSLKQRINQILDLLNDEIHE
jgi:hypothetical protein